MIFEIITTSAIAVAAVYMLYKNIKQRSKGSCASCRRCSGNTSCCCKNIGQ